MGTTGASSIDTSAELSASELAFDRRPGAILALGELYLVMRRDKLMLGCNSIAIDGNRPGRPNLQW